MTTTTILGSFIALCLQNIHPETEVTTDGRNNLSVAEARQYRKTLLTEWKDSVHNVLTKVLHDGRMKIGTNEMRFSTIVFDEKPSDGYALYISLHGGGETAPEVNDQQWHNQMRLYRPKGAIYLCPRGIKDTWNMHFLSETDAFYCKIIQMAIACMDVNPNKVYLLGYSAGGDGVWRLAPRLADKWAAASMMAGHPGDVSLVNMLNIPFSIWCGALDAAYERNKCCTERIAELDSLHQAHPDGYVHQGHIVEDKGHWMDRKDTLAIGWMASYQRNPYPKHIIWRQEEVTQPHFYWLSVPVDEQKRGREVEVLISGNTIELKRCDYSSLIFSLNDELIDLDKKVTVHYHGHVLFKGRLKRSRQTMRTTLFTRNDPFYSFPAQLQVRLP